MKSKSPLKYRQRWTKVSLTVLLVLIVVGTGAAVVVRRIYNDNLKPVSSSQTSKLVTIPIGSSPSEIANKLANEGLIRKSWAFEWYVRNAGLIEYLQAGTYSLKPSLSTVEIAEVLTHGKTATDLVTILPGKRLDQIRDSLINDNFRPAEVDAALDPARYNGHPALVDKPKNAGLEGYLFPETFHKDADTNPSVIIRKSLDEMHKRLTPDLRAAISKKGLTIYEGITLASIVEKEAGTEADKPVIAQVFLKRLNEGMRLESDPTAIYGAILDKVEIPYDSGKAAAAAIAHKSAYNTYAIKGLPPGPISNVSETSLRAVANPASTDYLFFVAGNDCKTRFSKSVEEHDRLKAEHGIGCKAAVDY